MKYKNILLEKFMIRKSKNEKTKFIEYIKDEFKNCGYDINVEKGNFGSRNIVFGDVNKAKVVFTAHYDTCAVMPVPNFITPTNFWMYCLYQMLIIIPIILIAFGSAIAFGFFVPGGKEFASLIYAFVLLFILGIFMFGPANKNTVNDNTSGTLTILELIRKLPDDLKDKVAFILFDLEEAGLFGSSSFASKHKKEMKEKLLINFDCVSDGDKLLFIFNKKAKSSLNLLKETYVDTDNVITNMITKGAFYPSDQANFKCGVGVCSVIRGKHFEYIDKIHTNKDTVLREENINYLVDKSINLIEKI